MLPKTIEQRRTSPCEMIWANPLLQLSARRPLSIVVKPASSTDMLSAEMAGPSPQSPG